MIILSSNYFVSLNMDEIIASNSQWILTQVFLYNKIRNVLKYCMCLIVS